MNSVKHTHFSTGEKHPFLMVRHFTLRVLFPEEQTNQIHFLKCRKHKGDKKNDNIILGN